jgi:tetratricopeptide (TPR) repeat protein
MEPRRRVAALACALAVLALDAHGAFAAPPDASAELRRRAAVYAYNLDHAEALRLLREAVQREPDNAANHRALAASLWLDILFRRGAVTVDNYLGSFSHPRIDVKKPPPDLDAEFKREIARAIDLARQRVAAAPRDPQAHYDLGTALGLEASYTASVEGRLMAGFKAARRSYDEQEQALSLDPSRKEAGLIVGTYRYIVSTLSLPMRLMAYIAGFGGGKDRGVEMIEAAAAAGGENRTDCQFALVLLYNREHRYDDALRVLRDLRGRFPRNRLVLLEYGATSLRAGRAADADRALTEGLQMFADDDRPKIPGESALWHYKRGTARASLHEDAAAAADLAQATGDDAAGWVRGRAHLELARVALHRGDEAAARREAALAVTACGSNNDPKCVEDAKRLK